MNSLQTELKSQMDAYLREMSDAFNSTFTNNSSAPTALDTYSRVAAFNATKLIINEESKASIFIEKAANDLLGAYLLALLGSPRLALVSLRALIESSLYYIYYKDHPIELSRWKLGKFRLKFKEYFKYIKDIPSIQEHKLKDTVIILEKEYGTLSLAVYGASENFMMTTKNNFPNIITTDTKTLSMWNTRSKTVFSNLIRLYISQNKEKFITGAHRHEKNIIRQAICQQSIINEIQANIGVHL